MLLASVALSAKGNEKILIATDYMNPDGETDVTEAVQKLIDDNPNRTIYFPDGLYLVSKPILTPADPKKSVMLVLANYAHFKAIGEWGDQGAIFKLGASWKANDINTPGSNYTFEGGIVDGNNIADGISIDGGRETKIQNVSIKNTHIGIYIKHGANNGSSDSDIRDVNIVGDNTATSIGVLVEGYDNTIQNMRIASVNVGVWLKSGGNSLHDLHPLYIFNEKQDYPSSCGFRVDRPDNWLYFCYSDNFATGYKFSNDAMADDTMISMTNCFCFWYTGKVPSQCAISSEGKFNAIVNSLRVGFRKECPNVTILKVKTPGGNGTITGLRYSERELTSDDVHKDYMK